MPISELPSLVLRARGRRRVRNLPQGPRDLRLLPLRRTRDAGVRAGESRDEAPAGAVPRLREVQGGDAPAAPDLHGLWAGDRVRRAERCGVLEYLRRGVLGDGYPLAGRARPGDTVDLQVLWAGGGGQDEDIDEDGQVVATLKKTLYVRKKRPKSVG